MSVNKLSYPQRVFINDKLIGVLAFMDSSRKIFDESVSEIFRENGEHKNFIIVDYEYKKGKDKFLEIELGWGKYDKLESEDDYYRLMFTTKKKIIKITNGFNSDKIILEAIEFLNEKLKEL